MGSYMWVYILIQYRYDFNSRVPYINNNHLCVAKKGIRYTVLMISK